MNTTRKNAGFAASLFIGAIVLTVGAGLMAPAGAAAQEGAVLNGYARTKVGAFAADGVDGGDYFLAENTLDLRFSQNLGDAAFYANAVLYEREGEVLAPELREIYIDYLGESFDLRLGKQQIIWGKGDGVFITDLVSPKDLSQFLIPDFEELRRAVTGAKADLYAGYHGLQLVWLPWFTPTVSPAADSVWAPELPFAVTPTFQATEEVAFNLENGEYFAKYSYLGEAFDIALMGGYFWNDTLAYTLVSPGMPPTVQGEYYRTAAAGYAVSGILGPVVLRSEGAFYLDKRYQGDFAVYPDGYAEKNALQYLAGADWSWAGFTLGAQYIQDIILDHEDDLLSDQFKNTLTLALSRTFLRETVTLEIFSYLGLDHGDGLVKPKVTWDAADGLEFFAGAYRFFGDEGDYGQYDDRDGGYVGAKLSF